MYLRTIVTSQVTVKRYNYVFEEHMYGSSHGQATVRTDKLVFEDYSNRSSHGQVMVKARSEQIAICLRIIVTGQVMFK